MTARTDKPREANSREICDRPRRDCQCARVKHEHGTRRAYERDRCRCLLCRAAHSNAVRAYRNGDSWHEAYIDAMDTKQRLRALAAAGVTTRRVAAHSGLSYDMVTYLRGNQSKRVDPRLAELVDKTYKSLCLSGRSDADSRRCMTQARAEGYDPFYGDDTNDMHKPIADGIDEIAVERAMHGDDVPLTKAEMTYAVERLTRMGHSAREIGQRLHCSGRTAQRKRAA